VNAAERIGLLAAAQPRPYLFDKPSRYPELLATKTEISSKSKLAQFKQRYKSWPKDGMKVGVETDENGYWKIAL